MEDNTSLTVPNCNFPTGKREIILLIAMAVCGVLMADFIFCGGFNMGFALMAVAVSILSFVYLRATGCKGGTYANALFALNLIIAASFIRSDDGFVKFVMVCFLLIGGNLSMVLTARQNRREPGGITSLLDVPMAVFTFGLGQMGKAFGGINDARKNAGTAGKKNMAILAGLAVAVPVMAVLIPLLMRADAAFEGLVNLLPEWDPTEMIISLIFGIPFACILYSRNTGLNHRPRAEQDRWTPRKFSALTVNTVLVCVGILYCVYLASQLAYFVGGFSGILPEEFTMAEYARRGFFEMTWLAAINLGIIVAAAALSEPKDGKVPVVTRTLCLFIGIVTLFFAATASAKMFLYIGSYGLTRLRLLVQVIIIYIALTVIFVAVWLLKPRFAYMKAVLLSAMIIGACVAWVDVDTVVAAYNVGAYQSGRLETVDISHLSQLGSGAVTHLQKLSKDPDPVVAQNAREQLLRRSAQMDTPDLRGWNIAEAKARDILSVYQEEAKKHQQIQDNIHADSLTLLCDYTDVGPGCQALMEAFPEMSKEGEPVTFCVKDRGMDYPNGEPFADCPFSYDALAAMDRIGISGMAVTDQYVYFRCDWDQSTILVWTQDPQSVAGALVEEFSDLSWYSVQEQWYIMKGSI